MISLLLRGCFALPGIYSAELENICISHIHKLLSRLLAASAAAAIHKYHLIFVGQLFGLFIGNALVGHINRVRNMAAVKFLSGSYIEDDKSALLLHYLCGFLPGDFLITVWLSAACKNQRYRGYNRG